MEVTANTPSAIGPEVPVEHIMTTALVAIHAEDRLADAAASMVQAGVRHLPVIDTSDRVVGMLSERDVRTAIGSPLATLDEGEVPAETEELLVSDAMTSEPRTLSPADTMADAVEAFLDERFGALPVVEDDDGRLLGIVSYIDILRALAASWEGTTA